MKQNESLYIFKTTKSLILHMIQTQNGNNCVDDLIHDGVDIIDLVMSGKIYELPEGIELTDDNIIILETCINY